MKEAMNFKKCHILTEFGERNLTVTSLIELHNIFNASYFTSIWHIGNPSTYSENQLQKLVDLYNVYCINEEQFLDKIKKMLLCNCKLTTKLLFMQ